MPIRPVAVVLNAGSGAGETEAAATEIRSRFAAAGREVQVTLATDTASLSRAVDEALAAGVSAIVAGGGDGTVNLVAARLIDSPTPLGVFPLGTLNHFAKDLGLPLELGPAIDVVLSGHTMQVDVGVVNGRCFLNNSSLGLYPRIVRLRAARPAHGLAKWLVATWATMKVLGEVPVMGVRIQVDGQPVLRRTTLVFIGNNEYRMAGLDAGTRESLTTGTLVLYVVRGGGRRRLARLAWHVLRGKAEESDALEIFRVTEATIESRGRQMEVALDGEVVRLPLPLTYQIRPGALGVLVAGGAGSS
ncbi:MAG: diacylglycerol kinase family protein [Gemmatimonadales bacterium]